MIGLLILNLLGLIPVYKGTRELPPKLVGFDLESNLPTLFSTAILALGGVLAWAIALAGRQDGKQYFRWMGIACIFFFLSIDETVMLHERATHLFRRFVEVNRFGLRHSAWTIPYAGLVVAVAAFYWRFFFRLPGQTRLGLVSGAGLYVAGAVGMEVVCCIWLDASSRDVVYCLLATLEELLEMIGVIVMIHTLACHLDRCHSDFSFAISSAQ